MGSREEERLREVLQEGARAYNFQEEPPDDEILHIRPKPRKKKPKVDQ